MTTVSGNNYTYVGTDLVNCIGGLIQRTGITANSTDTLPTATDIITSFTGENSSLNIGQSLSFAIFNNSTFNITLNQNTGITFVGTTSDDILPQGVRTYTVIQTAVSTAVIYIVGNSPLNPDISNTLYLTNSNIFVGNSSNIAIGVAMSGDATIANNGAITLANTSVTPASYTLSNITVDSKGRITSASNTTPQALTKTDDTNVTLTLGGTPSTALLQASSITVGWTGTLSGARGGTGIANTGRTITIGGNFTTTDAVTIGETTTTGQLYFTSTANNLTGLAKTNSAVLVSNSTGTPSWSSTMTNGQVIIGSTGATPVAATLTAGSGISITPGAGTITITATGGGGGAPGGLNTQLQYNNAGSFGGISTLTTDGTNITLASGNFTASGTSIISTTNTTGSSGPTSGSIVTSGGIGVTKNIVLGVGTGLSSATETGITFGPGQQNDFSIGSSAPVYGWIDLPLPLTSRNTGTFAPTYSIWNGGTAGTTGMYAYEFIGTGSTIKELFAEVHIPHDYTPGTGVYFHVHTLHNTAVPSGNFTIFFNYTYAGPPSNGLVYKAFNPTTTTTSVTVAAGQQYAHQIVEIASPVLSSSLEVDGVILLRIYRNPADATDNFTGSVWILFADCHINVSKFSTLYRSKQQASNSFYV